MQITKNISRCKCSYNHQHIFHHSTKQSSKRFNYYQCIKFGKLLFKNFLSQFAMFTKNDHKA
jgi:hypothetical protein